MRHSFSASTDQSNRSDSGDATSKRKCTNCAKIVLTAHPTSQTEERKPVEVHEVAEIKKKDYCETEPLSVPVQSTAQRIGLITVFDAILTGRQTGLKKQCLYGNPMSNNFHKTSLLKNP